VRADGRARTLGHVRLDTGGRLYRFRGFLTLAGAIVSTAVRRALRGAKRTGWSWTLEATTVFLRRQYRYADAMPDPTASRRYLDAFRISSAAEPRVRVEPAVSDGVPGHWFRPRDLTWRPEPEQAATDNTVPGVGVRRPIVYYVQSGGFGYRPARNRNLISWIALTSRVDVFVPDYRLAPEHAFPAALEDVMAGYVGLVEAGIDPRAIVVMGASSGGGLALAMLQALRDAKVSLPALAVLLSPWCDLTCVGESLRVNGYFDWLDLPIVKGWVEQYAAGTDLTEPRISPTNGLLTDLPPIYIQTGSADLFVSQVRDLERHAREQGAHVDVDVWPNMNHTFQMYGDLLEPSREALGRIRARVENSVRPTPVSRGARVDRPSMVSPARRTPGN
jgi:monoterpene epsilon-lactone hydrolase